MIRELVWTGHTKYRIDFVCHFISNGAISPSSNVEIHLDIHSNVGGTIVGVSSHGPVGSFVKYKLIVRACGVLRFEIMWVSSVAEDIIG